MRDNSCSHISLRLALTLQPVLSAKFDQNGPGHFHGQGLCLKTLPLQQLLDGVLPCWSPSARLGTFLPVGAPCALRVHGLFVPPCRSGLVTGAFGRTSLPVADARSCSATRNVQLWSIFLANWPFQIMRAALTKVAEVCAFLQNPEPPWDTHHHGVGGEEGERQRGREKK